MPFCNLYRKATIGREDTGYETNKCILLQSYVCSGSAVGYLQAPASTSLSRYIPIGHLTYASQGPICWAWARVSGRRWVARAGAGRESGFLPCHPPYPASPLSLSPSNLPPRPPWVVPPLIVEKDRPEVAPHTPVAYQSHANGAVHCCKLL